MAKRALAASARGSACWLLKSEPADYGIADMAREGRTVWDGVRNPQARKNMRAMAVGDRCLFYHSSCGPRVGVAGVVTVCGAARPDPADAAWTVVDVEHLETWPRVLTVDELKAHREAALSGMALFKQPRLSVQPVSEEQFEFVLSLRPDADGDAGGTPAKKAKRSG